MDKVGEGSWVFSVYYYGLFFVYRCGFYVWSASCESSIVQSEKLC